MLLGGQVYKASGPKWRAVYELYSRPEWKDLARGYRAVMVADQGVGLQDGVCVLNRCAARFPLGQSIAHEAAHLVKRLMRCVNVRSGLMHANL